MERYENMGLVGEGSYGMVLKCKHKETDQVVAIKKFLESEDDKMVKKIALREIKMLKTLRHENLVNLLEVFRRKKKLFLVFEFVDRTILDDLERFPDGLPDGEVKSISFQVLRGLEFCHSHNVIHRDVKPENILISKSGVVKLCDFGFARTLATGPGEVFTDYVATRWYRAPELLVGDVNYGKAVDIWAVGCLLFEMITGDPLFPGDSDIDQLFHITKALGNLCQRHKDVFHRNPLFTGMKLPNIRLEKVGKKFGNLSTNLSNLITESLCLEVQKRLSCTEMMKHAYYQENDFATKFLVILKERIQRESSSNPFLKSLAAQKQRRHSNAQSQRDKHSPGTNNTNNKNVKLKAIQNHQNDKNLKSENTTKDKTTPSQHCPVLVTTSLKTASKKTPSPRKANDIENNNELNLKHSKNISNGLKRNSESDKVLKDMSRSQLRKSEGSSPEVKGASRTILDVSINQPGKNLPEICSSVNINRARGHDVIKLKKGGGGTSHGGGSKKSSLSSKHIEHEPTVPLYPVAEKATLFTDKSSEEILNKCSKKKGGEIGLPKVSGLVLPIVKQQECKTNKTSPTRGSRKLTVAPTIPHIQNIDPFSMHFSPSKEPTTTRKSSRDNNLPAV
ncbi:cyclin-dependent kinase-like 1 [Clytia hemisphaerica]|uniref:cyclin-dependent kinase n=1 Tax=Clytia hemisphaerica TaxID=252671 RepID=A0A7M5WWU2_9CNID